MLHTNSQAVINGGGVSQGYPTDYGIYYHFGGYYVLGGGEVAGFDLFASQFSELYFRVSFNGLNTWQRLAKTT